MNVPDKKLWSLRELFLEFNPGRLLVAIAGLSNFSAGMHGDYVLLPVKNWDEQKEKISLVVSELKRIGLPTSLKSAERLESIILNEVEEPSEQILEKLDEKGKSHAPFILYGPLTFKRYKNAVKELLSRFDDEFDSRTVLSINPALASFYKQESPPFGASVFDSFPSAVYDIEESAKCLALERPTACVMHLQKALEAGLKGLATSVGVGSQNDWGSYIREINKILDAKIKESPKRSDDEKFYAEASASFDRLKRAYRNPTMHLDRRYDLPQARDIFDSIKSFMGLLATRISE